MKQIILGFFWILLSACLSVHAQKNKLDSLETLVKQNIADSLRVELMNQVGFDYIFQNTPKAAQYFEEAIQLAQKIQFTKGEANAYNMKGLLYRVGGLYEQALTLHFRSLRLYESVQHKDGMAYNFSNIGMVYAEQKDYEKAITYYQKALSIKTQLKDSISLTFTLNDIAAAHLQLKRYDSTLFYNSQSLKIGEILRNKSGIAYNMLIIGHVFYFKKDYTKAEKYLLRSEDLCKGTQNAYVEVQTNNILANLYLTTEKREKSLHYALQSLEIAKKYQMKKDIKEAAFSLAKIYAQENNYAEAYEYQNMFIAYKDSLNNLDLDKKTALMAAQYEYESKENKLKTEHAQTTLKQNWIIFSVVVALFSVSLIVFFIFKSRKRVQKAFKDLQKAHQEIVLQREEIQQQKEELVQTLQIVEAQQYEIETRSNNITASINYALRIQNAIIPKEAELKKHLDCFVFFRPKDIVSGDFYWFAKKQGLGDRGQGLANSQKLSSNPYSLNPDIYILAVADCTGHGVSGAFMTMIGNNILNQIVHDQEIHEPDKILNLMPILLEKTLLHSEGKVADGMDISIVSIEQVLRKDTNNGKGSENLQGLEDLTGLRVSYAGAMNPLYYVQNQEFKEIKADKKPIGGKIDEDFSYQKHEIRVVGLGDGELENSYPLNPKPCTLYLCTDGFQDQFGGKTEKKFMVKNLKKLLFEISQRPMAEQKILLDDAFDKWKGIQKQTDDVLVVGIRV